MATIQQTARPATAADRSRTTTPKTPRRRRRAAAVGIAAVATSLTWLAGHASGADFLLSDSAGKVVLSLPIIIGFTVWFSLLGWGSLALLERFTRRARTYWTVLAVAVTLLSLVPIYLETATSSTQTGLVLIHLAVAAVLIPMLRRSTLQARET